MMVRLGAPPPANLGNRAPEGPWDNIVLLTKMDLKLDQTPKGVRAASNGVERVRVDMALQS